MVIAPTAIVAGAGVKLRGKIIENLFYQPCSQVKLNQNMAIQKKQESCCYVFKFQKRRISEPR
jgi:hypothetical protein